MLDIALKLLKDITDHSYKAYIVGGFVRDYLLGIESSDIDITTDATPKEVKELFANSCLPNDDYGSVVVIKKGIRFDITTFREERDYEDHRKPNVVQYIDDLYPDLLRRDFTINTLCMDDKGEIIDYLGGKEDIKNRVIRTVGDPYQKFSDDSLRILRAIRFATILDFDLSDDVILAIKKTKSFVKTLSYTRKKEELDKIFNSPNRDKGIKYLLNFELDKELEIDNLFDVLGKDADSSISIWSLLDVSPKYPFNKSEKELMGNIRSAMELNNMDPMALYTYGLYVNSCAGRMKGLDIKDITDSYIHLAIHSRDEIDIDSDTIMMVLNRKPGKYIKEVYADIEREILYRRLNNNRADISSYIMDKYRGDDMKKIIKTFLLILVLGFCIPVFAAPRSTMELINKDEVATVETEMFTYTDISYSATVPNRSFGRINFKSVTNKTAKTVPISIDLLLFDAEGKNIGYVTYCTDSDVGGDFSDAKLAAGQSKPFYINVGDKYFGEEKLPTDVAYYAVQDDNSYCHVGGYDKYLGLTIDDIKQGRIMMDDGTGNKFMYDQQLMELLSSISLKLVMVVLIAGLVICIVKGLFLNALYKRMFDITSPFSYLPICSEYIAIKLAFGSMIAKIYIIASILMGPLSLVLPAIGLLSIVLGLVNGFAWILDLVKLITKKYELCYLEPYVPIESDEVVKLRLPNEKTKIPPVTEEKKEEKVTEEEKKEDVPEEKEKDDVGSQVLNLDYDDTGKVEDDFEEPTNVSNDNSDTSLDVDVNDLNKNILDEDNEINNKEGESDLMNLFK